MDRRHCGKRRNRLLQTISSFPKVFSKDMYSRHVNLKACLERVNDLSLTLYQTMITFDPSGIEASEKHCWKGKNACNLFPQCFLTYQINTTISDALKLSSARAFNLDKTTIFLSGKGCVTLQHFYNLQEINSALITCHTELVQFLHYIHIQFHTELKSVFL